MVTRYTIFSKYNQTLGLAAFLRVVLPSMANASYRCVMLLQTTYFEHRSQQLGKGSSAGWRKLSIRNLGAFRWDLGVVDFRGYA